MLPALHCLHLPASISLLTLQEERQEQDADFKPNLINTVCFLVNFIIQARHSPADSPSWLAAWTIQPGNRAPEHKASLVGCGCFKPQSLTPMHTLLPVSPPSLTPAPPLPPFYPCRP